MSVVLRFYTLYEFIESKGLNKEFVEYVKKEHFENCPPAEAQVEWDRIVKETIAMADGR